MDLLRSGFCFLFLPKTSAAIFSITSLIAPLEES